MRKPRLANCATAILAASSLTSAAQAGDLTLVQTSSSDATAGPNAGYTTTMLIHGVRSRTLSQSMGEDSNGQRHFGPHIAMIQQCDLRRTITVDLDNRIYSIDPLPAPWTRERLEAAKAKAAAEQQKSPQTSRTITIRSEITDTGERREAFGRTLRHYRIQTATIPGSAVSEVARKETSDGWYVEIPEYQQLDGCRIFPGMQSAGRASLIASSSFSPGQPPVRFVHEQTGPSVLGYPADVTTTRTQFGSGSGTPVRPFPPSVPHRRIDQLSDTPLDPALFEIPAGFARVDKIEMGTAPPTLSYRLTIAWARLRQAFTG